MAKPRNQTEPTEIGLLEFLLLAALIIAAALAGLTFLGSPPEPAPPAAPAAPKSHRVP